jgi:hypothetical protein
MSTPVKVAAFVVAMVVSFLGARAVGVAVGPLDVEPPATAHDGGGHADDAGGGHADEAVAAVEPGGLAVSREGYTLRVVSRPRAGIDRPLRFVVDGPDGEPVTAYDEVHGKRLHLIKIRRDGADYQHVHPALAPDGTWTARMTLAPGSNRLLADFTPTGGPDLVLGTDVELDGDYEPIPRPAVSRTARIDGYRVTLAGDLVPGEASPVTATVTRRGEPVTDLRPYLGAYGHLVALREGDLAYLHVHPEESGAGPEVPFVAEVPSAGRYRLFLDFRHRGLVRTVGFTLRAGQSGVTDGEGADHDH